MKTYFGSKPTKICFPKKKTHPENTLWTAGLKIENWRGSFKKTQGRRVETQLVVMAFFAKTPVKGYDLIMALDLRSDG